MAEFMSKEKVDVSSGSQSTANIGGGTLAQDIQTLMGGVGAIGKDYINTQVAESKRVGELLARDMLIGLTKEKGAIFEEIASDPKGYNYRDGAGKIDTLNAKNIADVKTKLGEDSIAYREFEDKYLFRASEYSEGIKSSLITEGAKVGRKNQEEATDKQLNEMVEVADPKLIGGMVTSYEQAGLDRDAISEKILSTFIGSAVARGFDAKKLYNADGTINRQAEQAMFSKLYGAIAKIDGNGSISAIGDAVQQKHLDTLASKWKTAIHVEKQKSESNELLKFAIFSVNQDKTKQTASGNIETDNKILDAYDSALDTAYNSVPFNSKENTLAYNKAKEEVKLRRNELANLYLASGNPSTVNEALTTGYIKLNDGQKVKVEEKEIKSIVQSVYDKNINGVVSTLSDNSISEANKSALLLKNTQMIIDYEKQTGVKSATTKAITDRYKGMSFESVDDLKNNLRLIQTLQANGYAFSGDDVMLTPDAIKAVETTINTMKDKTNDEIKLAIQATRNTFNAKKNTEKAEEYNTQKASFEKIFKDENIREEIFKGGLGVASKASVDSWVTVDSRIKQSDESMSKVLASFTSHNNVVQDVNEFMEKSIVGQNTDTFGVLGGTYSFNLLRAENNSVTTLPVNLDVVSKQLVKESKNKFVEKDLFYTYDYDYATRSTVLKVHQGDIRGIPVMTMPFDEVKAMQKRYYVETDANFGEIQNEAYPLPITRERIKIEDQ